MTDLFTSAVQPIVLQDAELYYLPDFLPITAASAYFDALMRDIPWRQEIIKMYGKEMPVPRLSAWCGEAGVGYSYSGIGAVATGWDATLLEIKLRVEEVCEELGLQSSSQGPFGAKESAARVSFNSALANLYRSGEDSVSWHADDEPELGRDPLIASVSLGESRVFQLRHKSDKHAKFQIELAHGSLLVMAGSTQRAWKHQLPKSRRVLGPRINLTYRHVFNEGAF